MKTFALLPALLLSALAAASAAPSLEEVAGFPTQQVTGITVSKTGRIFVNFPLWQDGHQFSVAEIKNGQPVPYPSAAWNQDSGDPAKRFVCVQSVVVDPQDNLWALDAGSPKMEGTLPGGPKLVKIDLTKNEVVETIPMPESVAPKHSYLNDIRFDPAVQHAFITESGLGALIIVDLRDQHARRVLTKHPGTQPETGTDLVVDGIRLIDPKTKTTPTMNADGIAIDNKDGWLYFRPLTGHTVYRVRVADLLDETLRDEELSQRVEKSGQTPATDGMLETPDGKVLCAAFETDAIVQLDPQTHQAATVIQDKRLQWPDTMSWGPDGALYVTCSQIHRMAKYNEGVSKQAGPYMVYKVTGLGR